MLKKQLFFAKNFLLRPAALKFHRQLRAESRLSDDEREAISLRRMKQLLQIAYDGTEFYRDKFRSHAVSPADLKTLNDIKKFPTLTKNEIRDNFTRMQVKGFRNTLKVESTTGGSTGIPLKVIHDKTNYLDVVGWYVLQEWGLDISDNASFLERYNPHGTAGNGKTLVNKLLWWPTRRSFISITEMTTTGMGKYVEQCIRTKPAYIEGYVGAVLQFAEFLIEKKISLPSVKLVWTTSAPLSRSARITIQRAFRSPVVDQYGCCEIYWLGYECLSHQGLHVFDTIRHYEILDDGRNPDDSFGDLIITDLLNSAFPLIRYEIKDRSRWIRKSCDCGVTFPLMEHVKGRESDSIRFPEGGGVPGEFLTTIFDSIPECVKQFQIIQLENYSIKVLVVPSSEPAAVENVAGVIENLNETWPSIEVELQWVRDIPHDDGKIRYVKSLLSRSQKSTGDYQS